MRFRNRLWGVSYRSGVPRVTILSKPGCHLCGDARAVVQRVTAELGETFDERDITGTGEESAYWDKIPVVLVDGVVHSFWRVSERRLTETLARNHHDD